MSAHAKRFSGGPPLLIAESAWADQHAYVQYRLDHEPESRALVKEARDRADAAMHAAGGLRSWDELDQHWSVWSRPVRDYCASVKKAARFLCLGNGRAEQVHELVVAGGYTLARPVGPVERPPQPGVASAIHADTTGNEAWRSGAVANRRARQRYLSATKFKL